MNSKTPRKYASPLREAQANETRERILAAVAVWMKDDAHGDFTYDDIAREAKVERRTVFRHFETKDALLEAFWGWINQRILPSPLPRSLDELVNGPRSAFPGFDEVEGVIRGSLHTRAGRAMRMGAVTARQEAFHNALLEATEGASPEDRLRLEAIAHALYSAAAWETMRDYAGLTGEQAGDAASWALDILTNAVRQTPAGDATNTRTNTRKRR